MEHYNTIIIGTGPAGLGAAFELTKYTKSILLIDKEQYCSGGMRNDCKMNFSSIVPEGQTPTRTIGFPENCWTQEQIDYYIPRVKEILKPVLVPHTNMETYQKRAARLGCELLDAEQTHLGTDGGLELIKKLYSELTDLGVTFQLSTEVTNITDEFVEAKQPDGTYQYSYDHLIVAPGRKGFSFLQDIMNNLDIPFTDNVVDIGVRVETKLENYSIVKDCYDPKIYFPNKVRTFCTNSGNAHVVKEKYEGFSIVNGHAYSKDFGTNTGLANFALLKTVKLTEPLASGSEYAESLCKMANLLGGGKPIMQRVGDIRLGHRSHKETFNEDLFDFKPSLECTPGDITIAMPAKIFDDIWKSLKKLDTICPGVLSPSTILYYPEIKFYANKPKFIDNNFRVKEKIWFAGDGAGTSRGISAAWASGIRVAEGIING